MSNKDEYFLFKDIKNGLKFIRSSFDNNKNKSNDDILCIITYVRKNKTQMVRSTEVVIYYTIKYIYYDNNNNLKIDEASLRNSKNNDRDVFGEKYLGYHSDKNIKSYFKFYFKKPLFTGVYPIEGKYYDVQAILSNTEKIFSIVVNINTLTKATLIKNIMESLGKDNKILEKFLSDNIYGGITGIVSIGTTIDFFFNGLNRVSIIIEGQQYPQILPMELDSDTFKEIIIILSSVEENPAPNNKKINNLTRNRSRIGDNSKKSNQNEVNDRNHTISRPNSNI
jgi:hypothetical protein